MQILVAQKQACWGGGSPHGWLGVRPLSFLPNWARPVLRQAQDKVLFARSSFAPCRAKDDARERELAGRIARPPWNWTPRWPEWFCRGATWASGERAEASWLRSC